MKDAAGKIIYVGKAINLRNRCAPISTAARTTAARRASWCDIADIEWIVVGPNWKR